MTRRLAAVSLALVASALGCVGAGSPLEVVKLNGPGREIRPRDPGSVTIFTTGAPARPFVEVALIQSRRRWGTTETASEIFERVRLAAAQTGCDGLVLLGDANTTMGYIWPMPGALGTSDTYGTIETLEGFRATCIVWRDDASEAPPPAPAAPPAVGAPPAVCP
jgi:hypothetical protein